MALVGSVGSMTQVDVGVLVIATRATVEGAHIYEYLWMIETTAGATIEERDVIWVCYYLTVMANPRPIRAVIA